MAKAAHRMSEIFTGADRAALSALRHSDPQANLIQRWKKILAANPDLVERRLAYVPQVIEHGWVVIFLPDQGFAYTIGLQYRFGQPELLIASPRRSGAELKRLLNAIGNYVRVRSMAGDPAPIIRAGEPVDIADTRSAMSSSGSNRGRGAASITVSRSAPA